MHIGIILDGNRRFAKKEGKKPWEGHEAGANKIGDLLNWCKEMGVKELTLYCFSVENFKRSKKEVDFLMDLFKRAFKKFGEDKRLDENKIKIRFIGDKERLSKELQEEMRKLEKKTKNYNNYAINFAIAYSGRQEIVYAVKKMIKEKKKITEANLQKSLWLPDEPDLMIRTSGEKRSSNFLPWQSVYSEWVFIDKLWPEVTKRDFKAAIREFHDRKRRFGK
jgi:tritrans,polycis-undecaprenyl-diphosphate synthase [geranylgeranyl-diphosphate specific]